MDSVYRRWERAAGQPSVATHSWIISCHLRNHFSFARTSWTWLRPASGPMIQDFRSIESHCQKHCVWSARSVSACDAIEHRCEALNSALNTIEQLWTTTPSFTILHHRFASPFMVMVNNDGPKRWPTQLTNKSLGNFFSYKYFKAWPVLSPFLNMCSTCSLCAQDLETTGLPSQTLFCKIDLRDGPNCSKRVLQLLIETTIHLWLRNKKLSMIIFSISNIVE